MSQRHRQRGVRPGAAAVGARTAAIAAGGGDRRLTRRRSTRDRAVRLTHVAAASILHVDMDAFFVSVELRRRPELRGQPVVVGGTGRRGVVAAASYEARRYGVHSAMPSAHGPPAVPARGVPAGRPRTRTPTVSAEVHDDLPRRHPARRAARRSTRRSSTSPGPARLLGDGADDRAAGSAAVVDDELDLTCSVGVAPNKFLAKLASVDGQAAGDARGRAARAAACSRCAPGEELAFLHPLPVGRLWGVGPATLERLRAARGRHGRRPRRPRRAVARRRRSGEPTAEHLRRPRRRPRRPAGRARTGGQVDRPRGDVRHTTSTTSTSVRTRDRPAGRRRRRPAAGQRRRRPHGRR